jgi:hypothetical protein
LPPRCALPVLRLAGVVIGVASATLAGAQAAAPHLWLATLISLPLPLQARSLDSFVGGRDALSVVDYATLTVHVADANGSWQTLIRPEARGPGAQSSIGIAHFAVNGELWIADPERHRVMIRDVRGRMLREIKTESALLNTSAVRRGRSFLALSDSVGSLLLVCDSSGRTTLSVPLPPDLVGKNPAILERFLLRVNDTLSVVRFRWLPRLIALRNDGHVFYDLGAHVSGPAMLRIRLDRRGTSAERVDPSAREDALGIASRKDTLLILRGGDDQAIFGRRILRQLATTGVVLDQIALPGSQARIAATRRGVFALSGRDSTTRLNEVRWK